MFSSLIRSVLFEKYFLLWIPRRKETLSQNTLFSIDFSGYDCRSVLKHVLKSYDFFLSYTTVVSELLVWFTRNSSCPRPALLYAVIFLDLYLKLRRNEKKSMAHFLRLCIKTRPDAKPFIWKCEFMIDHRSYTQNLSSCEIKAWNNSDRDNFTTFFNFTSA